MTIKKKKIIKYLQLLLEHNLYGNTQEIFNKAYKNRIVGFRSELDFYSHFKKRELYSGGYLLPVEYRQATLSNPIYFTISRESFEKYKEIYKEFKTSFFKRLLFIEVENAIDFEKWNEIDVMNINVKFPVPSVKTYEFIHGDFKLISNSLDPLLKEFKSKKRIKPKFRVSKLTIDYCYNLLCSYSLEQLLGVYVDRLVFDGYIGYSKIKGIASDIDAISRLKGNSILCEIKEKDVSKKPPIGFGMDIQRIDDLKTLKEILGLEYLYIVKEVDNQIDRAFIDWRYITIDDFVDVTKENPTIDGGLGMSNISVNKTIVCPKSFFKTILPPKSNK